MKRNQRISLLLFLVASLTTASLLYGQQPAKVSQGAKPSVNDAWKSPDVDSLVGRLENESREIYHQRARLAVLVGPKAGSAVADVGAGSGFMVEEFAKLVGPKGKVYAVDINARMMERVSQRAKQLGYPQVQTVVTHEDSVDLQPASVDIVFVCDTYHHFEYPEKSLAGIRRALRPGGELVIVDFNRVPGKTPQQMMEHGRAGKEEVIKEVTGEGFMLAGDEAAPFLRDNYVLRFRVK